MHTTSIGVIAGGLPSAFHRKENERADQGANNSEVLASAFVRIVNLNLHYLLTYYSGCKLAVLYVKCKTCGITFSSGIAIDEKSFQSVILKENKHTCPKGHVHGYNKGDYFFKRAS